MLMEKYKTTIWYRLYQGMEKAYDSQGRFIGNKPKYSAPTPFRIHVGWARGTADTEMFGINVDYDKPMVTNKLDCPIDETSVLLVDHKPTYTDGELDIPYDYVVKKVAKSKNYITYAIKMVNVVDDYTVYGPLVVQNES